jgi:hypothetical protein
MRNEFLRDVMAGSAGVLLVLAVIGLPKDPAAAPQAPPQPGDVHLLPYYSSLHPQVPAPPDRPAVPARPTP